MIEGNSVIFAGYLDYVKEVMKEYNIWSADERKFVEHNIAIMEEKLVDNNLYLGVIGSFSSGKSTFANSMLNQYLVPTDAVQGTTVVTSILKNASKNDLKICYFDGSVLSYSLNRSEINQKYNVKSVAKDTYSYWKNKVVQWGYSFLRKIKEIVGCLEHSELKVMSTLFKRLSSIEELSKEIECIVLELNNVQVKPDIAIVDIPGIEATNQYQKLIIQNTIDNICDAFVVIIPYDEPVSESLLNYLKSHLGDQLQNCIYVVTKIELLDDMTELPRLIKVISTRLQNGLDINVPTVIPMPTLLHLEECNSEIKKTGLFNSMDFETKKRMLTLYENGIKEIYEILKENKRKFISNKLYLICHKIRPIIHRNLCKEMNTRNKNIQSLIEKRIKPVDEFEKWAETAIVNREKSCIARRQKEKNVLAKHVVDEMQLLITKINNCKKSGDIISQLKNNDNLISKVCSVYLNYVNAECDHAKQDFLNVAEGIFQTAFSLYKDCNVMQVTELELDNFESSLVKKKCENDVKEIMCNASETLISNISKDTDGLFSKIKCFFSDPLPTHKSMCESTLAQTADEIQKVLSVRSEETLNKYENTMTEDSQKQLEMWIRTNQEKIIRYAEINEQAILDNVKQKNRIENVLSEMEQYMIKLGEHCA